MIALDTNVLVRLLTRDDPDQAAIAEDLVKRSRTWLPRTVLLETEWVLRSAYALPRDRIADGLRGLLAVATLTVEDADDVRRALGWYDDGLDLADALHLASASACDALATFDQRFAARAARAATRPPVDLLDR